MQTRTLLNRIKRAEDVAEARSIVSPQCICFPAREPPFFGLGFEMELAFRVKCPLHGDRFKPCFPIYVSPWLREKLWSHLWTQHSEQYRKAWFASFPPDLWPAREEATEAGFFLVLKDGSRLRANGSLSEAKAE